MEERTLDIKEVVDYAGCPMLYKYRYVDRHPNKPKTISLREKYDVDLHKCIYSFFIFLKSEGKVSLRDMKKRWADLWVGNTTTQELAYSDPKDWRDVYQEKLRSGIDAVLNFWNFYSDNPGDPIVINQRYALKLACGITLTGTWDLIREVEYGDVKILEVIDFKTGDFWNNKLAAKHDMEITAASYAFRSLFRSKEDGVVYHGLTKNAAYRSTRNNDDFRALEVVVANVAKAIEQKLYYACPSDKCNGCAYKTLCRDKLTLSILDDSGVRNRLTPVGNRGRKVLKPAGVVIRKVR